MSEEVLIVFVKNPELGKVKTRLAKSIGDAQALAIYLKLLNSCFELTEAIEHDVVIYYNNYVDSEDQWNSKKYKKYLQKGDSLGDKMHNAIAEQLNKGYKKACLVGSDIYELNLTVIETAFKKLKNNDVVIGPAQDGGYYLIGMNEPNAELFDISGWSTSTVFEETITKIREQKLTYDEVETLNDIDDINDLKKTDLI